MNNFNIKGLDNQQVLLSQNTYGKNALVYKKESGFLGAIRSVLVEPMVLLLFGASLIYFISGEIGDAIFLGSAIVLVATISLYQDTRSRNALEKLRHFTEPTCKVIRNSDIIEIRSEDIVVGDSLLVEEGTTVAADGIIQHSNDFSVNESILTGESFAVSKDVSSEDNRIYLGSSVVSGLAIITVTEIGNSTKLGKIGKSIDGIEEEKTPLENQISNLVKIMVVIGAIVFAVVFLINYFHSHNFLDSLLKALTLAMSILPEEIPVAFTTFMALGAWRLMKMGIVVKQMKTVETLGSATVICTDKTGTITENKMSVAQLFLVSTHKTFSLDEILTEEEKELIALSMWASEPIPFDPMEIALHKAYEDKIDLDVRPGYKLFHEYPLGGKPPMMTHIFQDENGHRIIAAKGAPEALLAVSDITAEDRKSVEVAIQQLASNGYRVLGVGQATFEGNDFPKIQQDFKFHFKGIVAFYDPPKKNIQEVLAKFYAAGISVKIITGDNIETTTAIAKEVGLIGSENAITGDALMQLDDAALKDCVMRTTIFARMFPDAKLKIIQALKAQGQIVAMTGDGVNDGPALKAAHIGIAMGKKGTEIAKQAASLILLEDDLSKMVDAIAMGRKIYTNLKKAIQYIISIHIPIILTVFIPLALGWIYPNIFSPLHIIFLELIMGPTCSIIYENEPMEKNTMLKQPRAITSTFFNWGELSVSIVQGLIITLGTLAAYQYAVHAGYNEAVTRTMTFVVLIVANIFLTLVNRSFYYSIFTVLKYKNSMVYGIIFATISMVILLMYVKPLTQFFDFESLQPTQLIICTAIGFASVIWFEFYKMFKRKKVVS